MSGYSGIGKSSVVHELHKALVPSCGLFASGKFEQHNRDVPYATLVQALQALVRPLLTKSETELRPWRDAIRNALDPHGQLIVNLVPELRLIIGEQHPVPDVAPNDAQARFHMIVRRFVGVFARPEHPLVLFFDDLHWLDPATLDLLQDLLTQPDVKHFLLIGAYRDNEVGPSHPLTSKLSEMRRAGAMVQEIVLSCLTQEDVAELVAHSVHSVPERARALAELVHGKTTGNPFFAIQFLSELADDGLLAFDHREGRWTWDVSRIRSKGYTDNVVDLLVGRLSRMPDGTQEALKQLACLGGSAEFTTLNAVHEAANGDLERALREAVEAGLVLRSDLSYRFLHDRVQEAAYSLIPPPVRATMHLRIGRLLIDRHSGARARGEDLRDRQSVQSRD